MGWYDYPKSTPRAAPGGIKAQGGRNLGGERWWAKRWIAVLESFNLGARLSRGRSYARKGQVLSIEIGPGQVNARVQGSRPRPYEVKMILAPLSAEAWGHVIAELSRRAIFLAKLLAGEMSAEIEEVFSAAGAPLFPARQKDLVTTCSCPDWSNPCKHIAAVFYLLGEEFDRDPFLLLTLRGMRQETLLEKLRAVAGGEEAQPATEPAPPEPLSSDPASFWFGKPLPGDFLGPARPPAVPAPLLRRLGDFPLWRGAEPLTSVLTPVYTEAADRARELLLRAAEHEPGGKDA